MGRRQNKQVVLRHELDHEPSTKLLKMNCLNPTGQNTTSGHSHTGKAELVEAEGKLGPKQGSKGRSSSGTDCGDTLQFLLALTAGARLVMGVQSRQLQKYGCHRAGQFYL